MAETQHGAQDVAAHTPGDMDITVQKKTFEGFMKFWVVVFGSTAFILIFLALFNS